VVAEFEGLENGEFRVEGDASESLFRQVTEPNWDGQRQAPSSLAFGPRTADRGKVSLSRASIVSAQEARDWHTSNAKKPSLGVWHVSVSDVDDHGSRAVDDSAISPGPEEPPKAPGHCYADYRHLSKQEERTMRSALLQRALVYGETVTTQQEPRDETD
jgi:hypothetical protein